MAFTTAISPSGWVLEVQGVFGSRVRFEIARPTVPCDELQDAPLATLVHGWIYSSHLTKLNHILQINDQQLFAADEDEVEVEETSYAPDMTVLMDQYERVLRRHYTVDPQAPTGRNLQHQINAEKLELCNLLRKALAMTYS